MDCFQIGKGIRQDCILSPYLFNLCAEYIMRNVGLDNSKVGIKIARRNIKWHPTPVLLPGKSHGWRSVVGCSPWDRKESDTTERLHFHFHFLLSCVGEGNGSPLQCSCLENPRDGGAWWAAVYGVTESDTTEATWQQQQHS